jgi:hypothetical protein
MHRNVETLLGRLATDPMLCRRFAEGPATLLGELSEQGFELTEVELEALAAIDPEAVRRFAASLDRRLRKAALSADRGLDSGVTAGADQPNAPSEKESVP